MAKTTFAVLLLLLCSARSLADPPPTFKYQGWVEADRWGILWLSNGVTSVRFEASARASVEPSLGKPVEIVTGPLLFSSPSAPTIGVVGAVTVVEPRYRSAAQLALRVGGARSLPGALRVLQLGFTYKGPEEIEYRLRDLRILLRRRGDPLPLETALDVRDRDDSTWRADGSSTEVDEGGAHDTLWIVRAPGDGLVKVKGEYSFGVELLTRLPAGAYEMWATFGSENLSKQPGVRHKRIAFDVAK